MNLLHALGNASGAWVALSNVWCRSDRRQGLNMALGRET